MASGIHLGCFLTLSLLAEYVSCVWDPKASQWQSGVSQTAQRRDDGSSSPRFEFRRALAVPGSMSNGVHREKVVNRARIRVPATGPKAFSQWSPREFPFSVLAPSSYNSATAPKPSWHTSSSPVKESKPQNPKRVLGLPEVTGGSAVSPSLTQSQPDLGAFGKSGPSMTRHGPSGSSDLLSDQNPSRGTYFTSTSQSAGQSYGQETGKLTQTGVLQGRFTSGDGQVPGKGGSPVGHLDSSHSSPQAAQKPLEGFARVYSVAGSGPSNHQAHSGNKLDAMKPYVGYGQAAQDSLYYEGEPSNSLQPRGSMLSSSQGLRYQPSYTAIEEKRVFSQGGDAASAAQVSLQTGGARSPGQQLAPTKTINIPQLYGGTAIRRLRDPVQPGSNVGKPQFEPIRTSVQQSAVYPQEDQVPQLKSGE